MLAIQKDTKTLSKINEGESNLREHEVSNNLPIDVLVSSDSGRVRRYE